MATDLKFHCEDNGNCRVYFSRAAALHCMQDEGHGGEVRFEFYRCSRDGEPSHNVPLPETFPDFEAKTRVGRDLKGWLAARPIGATRAPN